MNGFETLKRDECTHAPRRFLLCFPEERASARRGLLEEGDEHGGVRRHLQALHVQLELRPLLVCK